MVGTLKKDTLNSSADLWKNSGKGDYSIRLEQETKEEPDREGKGRGWKSGNIKAQTQETAQLWVGNLITADCG